MGNKVGFADSLVRSTERVLTRRKKRVLKLKMRQQSKHWSVDWAESILWAVCVVLIINQYLFQMYRIPSESMSGTLEVGDMIFVNKIVFGPELLPGMAKLSGPDKPRRGDVVVFENPTYLSRGPIFAIVQQFTYMLTLTLLDIDREPNGQPRVHFLIKRAVGIGGDRIKIVRGEVLYKFPGTADWISERDYKNSIGSDYPISRMIDRNAYANLEAMARDRAMNPRSEQPDQYDAATTFLRTRYAISPHDRITAEDYRRHANGWYVAENRVFPMGDNRDNSRDARYFDPVAQEKVLGKALFIYWPIGRIGGIR